MAEDSKTPPWTIKAVLDWSKAFLEKGGVSTPRLDAELLLANVLNCSRIDLYLRFDTILGEQERKPYRDMLRRRAAQEPVAYIIGVKEFYGLSFDVNAHVLIPRPETEMLIEEVLASQPNPQSSVLDLGTGSGCIAISLAKHLPKSKIVGWDISQNAISVAEKNNQKHQTHVDFQVRDFCLPASWDHEEKKDFILANPPYISLKEKDDIPKSVLSFEPPEALFADDDGMYYYKKIVRAAKEKINPRGKLLLEIGYEQKEMVESLLEESGWKDISTKKDLQGIYRVTQACP